MLFILMALLSCGEYKVLGQGPGSRMGTVLLRRGQSLTRAYFAGLCNGALAEEIGEFFPAPDWDIPFWRSEITTECQCQYPGSD